MLEGTCEFDVEEGHVFADQEIPVVKVKDGHKFVGWSGNVKEPIVSDTIFYVDSDTAKCNVRFVGDSSVCSLDGITDFEVPQGTILNSQQIPNVISKEGYSFKGWTPDVSNRIIQNTVFSAQV